MQSYNFISILLRFDKRVISNLFLTFAEGASTAIKNTFNGRKQLHIKFR